MMIGAFGLKVYHPKTGKVVGLIQESFEEVGKSQLPLLVQQIFRLGNIQTQKYKVNKGGYPYSHSKV